MKVLIVDDDQAIRSCLQQALTDFGHTTILAESGEIAFELLKTFGPDVLITDLNLGRGINGLELMEKTKAIFPQMPMIMLTGFPTIKNAFDTGKLGGVEFLAKPLDLDTLQKTFIKITELKNIHEDCRNFQIIQESAHLKTYNPVMQKVIDTCKKIASNNYTVLITGESGTGKSLLAKMIHMESGRREKPFVNVNCATLSENLLESEIFGHVKGSFTGAFKDKIGRFEAAAGGTIFLDEIAEISPSLQTKLLRFLQDHEFERVGDNKTIKVDIRIVAATNKKLEIEVAAGRFREDLYYRLNVIDIHVPTLRERFEDIEHLADTYLGKAFIINGGQPKPLSPEAKNALRSYNWPGNVRELESALTKASVLCAGDQVEVSDLPDRISAHSSPSELDLGYMTNSDSRSIEDMEKIMIQKTLNSSRTIDEAAAQLGINSSTLWRKRKKYNIE